VDDAAEYVATSDPATVYHRRRTLYRWGELKASVRSRLVVMPDVFVEHQFDSTFTLLRLRSYL
jgi:RNA-binding protein YlmH